MTRFARSRTAHQSSCILPALLLLLTACGGGGSGSGGNAGGDPTAPRVPVTETRAGEQFSQTIPVEATGDDIVVEVFEPATLEAGESYPLVLHSHGYGGSRSEAPDEFQQRLIDAGYYVVSIDQRGFGDSSGTVRVQSPDFEGRDLVAVLDWAEDLPGLARRTNGDMLVGSYGGSYGGMYQLLLAALDPEQRLRVIAPDITPHDLVYSLNQGNVIKSGWALALVGTGETGITSLLLDAQAGNTDPAAVVQEAVDQVSRLGEEQSPRQDPVIYETLIEGALANRFPDAGSNLFAYHSFRHFCDAQTAGPQDGFRIGEPDPLAFSPGSFPPRIDALLTQGFRDTLFNVNEALENYDCLRGTGGDVRLLTHQTGHVLPAGLDTIGAEDPLDPFYAAINPTGFQGPGGSFSCGSINLDEARFAWFESKLKSRDQALATALPSGDDICLSLAEDDAIAVEEVATGGTTFEVAMQTATSGVTGVLDSLLGNEVREPLQLGAFDLTATDDTGGILAGIPTLTVDVQPLVDLTADLGLDCSQQILPAGCDPILFFALGQRPPGQERWDIVEDQLTPVRGFGTHKLEMVAVAERLNAGDELALLVYGFHPQYPVTLSRDLLVPAVTINGAVSLPLLEPADVIDPDV